MVKISLSALAFALGLLAFAFLSFTNSAHAASVFVCPDGTTPTSAVEEWLDGNFTITGKCKTNPTGHGSGGAGAGGDWCPEGFPTNPDGSCKGLVPPSKPKPEVCLSGGYFRQNFPEMGNRSTALGMCKVVAAYFGQTLLSVDGLTCRTQKDNGQNDQWGINKSEDDCAYDEPELVCPAGQSLDPITNKCVKDAPPDFPDLPPPPSDGTCNPCQALYEIRLKLNHLKNVDINNITNTINQMNTLINNIDNSINDLSVNQEITNNNLTMIDNSLSTLITNIENNSITTNEIKNEVNNIKNVMNDYSLELGDIKLAMGDIDLSLKNTNKLVLDLGLDIDFIKNNLVNGGDNKDYTAQLNTIIDLLKPCEPTEEKPCPDDDEVVKKLKEIQDFMIEDFLAEDGATQVDVEDLTDIQLDRGLISFGAAQCPPDNEFNTVVNGFSFSGGFKHKPLCDFFTLLAPFVKAFGGFSAALILGGGLRRG